MQTTTGKNWKGRKDLFFSLLRSQQSLFKHLEHLVIEYSYQKCRKTYRRYLMPCFWFYRRCWHTNIRTNRSCTNHWHRIHHTIQVNNNKHILKIYNKLIKLGLSKQIFWDENVLSIFLAKSLHVSAKKRISDEC